MATRGKMTFQKRQKEAARKDKQIRKAARRAQKKLDNVDVNRRESDDQPIMELDTNTEPPEL